MSSGVTDNSPGTCVFRGESRSADMEQRAPGTRAALTRQATGTSKRAPATHSSASAQPFLNASEATPAVAARRRTTRATALRRLPTTSTISRHRPLWRGRNDYGNEVRRQLTRTDGHARLLALPRSDQWPRRRIAIARSCRRAHDNCVVGAPADEGLFGVADVTTQLAVHAQQCVDARLE